MRTGVSYMGHHNPKHIATDMREMRKLGCDDVILAAQENDFVHFTGKLTFLPKIAADLGLRPIALFWGALNLFGGGRSSQFLLEHPEGHQKRRDGSWHPAGCYNNPLCVGRIKEMIARVAELGFQAYYMDEPTPIDCWCDSCGALFREWQGKDMREASDDETTAFRKKAVINYMRNIAAHMKQHHREMESMCALMPCDRTLWRQAAEIPELDTMGTDIYWVNQDNDTREMIPMLREMSGICRQNNKQHHEWLQCWTVRAGKEHRILEQGDILIDEKPDCLYIWAWLGQVGTTETCDNPEAAWKMAKKVLKRAKQKAGGTPC